MNGSAMAGPPHSVLTVCRANRRRSPMAVRLRRDRVAATGRPEERRIESASAWVEEGAPAAPLARQAHPRPADPGIWRHRGSE